MSDNVVRLVTKSRKELFNISAMLADAIEPEFLQDAQKPVIVSVTGVCAGGKSIFSDAVRRRLMSTASNLAFTGLRDDFEFWCGNRNGHDFEFIFANMNRVFQPEKYYYSERSYGGITFLHNIAKDQPEFGLNLNLELGWKKWGRRLEIVVRDERLKLSEKFQRALADIKDGKAAKGRAYGLNTALIAKWQESKVRLREKIGRPRAYPSGPKKS